MPLNIVIPMAGRGSRFAAVGYARPKPFIDVLGRTMIEHVLENLRLPDARFLAIARGDHLAAEAQTVERLRGEYPIDFLAIDHTTEGAACTVLYAHREIGTDDPLLLANSDQIVEASIAGFVDDARARSLDGSILTFHADDTKWSYARLDERGLVAEVREKVVISPHATVGLYYFRRGRSFVEAAIDMIVRNDRVNNEFYVCPVYNHAIARGERVGIHEIPKDAMFGTGTPEDLDVYIAHKKGR